MKKKNKATKTKQTKARPGFLTETEVRILRDQVRKNARWIDSYIKSIDLLINKEQCPADANTLLIFRRRLEVATAENDTFRKVLWRHTQITEQGTFSGEELSHVRFLVNRIEGRKRALIAQRAMK